MSFLASSDIVARQLFGGAIQARYAHLERLTLGEVLLEAGALVPMHHHEHEQISLMLEGRAEFTVSGETRDVGPGDFVLMPANAPHAVKALTACRVVDVFSPARDDYR